MPDSSSSNTDSNNTNTNTSGTTPTAGAQAVLIGCDINDSNDAQVQDTVARIVQGGGYTVTKLAIEPNAFATASYDSSNKGKKGVYLIAAGVFSISDYYTGSTNFDYAVFGIRGDIASQEAGREPGFSTKPIGSDPDCTACCAEFSGMTFPQMNEKAKGKLTVVGGATAEEIGQNVLKALGGGTATSGTSQGGGAVLIPDKTFYGLIKQMCGGVDGVFVIANNMAYLLSFKDIYEYRDKYDEFIPKIEAENVLSNSLDKNWSTNGLYNTVEVTYADGIVKYQNDALVQQYGENTFYYEFPEDDEETAKAKADALLSAHIRDYGFDIYVTTMYNPNITEGAWVKMPKKITNVSGFSRDEYEAERAKKKDDTKVGLITKKRKGITISEITDIFSKTEWGTPKHVQKIKDEEGETYEIEVEDSEYEMFFVNAYTLRWDRNHSLIMDLHLKYGPDTPEDPENATIGGGGGTESATAGGESATINEFVQKALQGVPNDDNSKAQAIYKAMVNVVRYDLYDCSHYSTPDECLHNASHLNCADSSRLGRACYSAGGLQCQVVHGPNHFWVEVKINGRIVASDVTGAQGSACVRPLGEVYNGLTKDSDCGPNPSC